MEFDGKIVRVLPAREGVSERTGNAWKSLPFVFEFFTPENQQWPERVLLETFSTTEQAIIAPYCRRGQDGKAMLNQYGDIDMTAPVPVHIGFSIKVRTGKRQDGTPFTVNNLSIYKFEPIQQQPAYQPAPQQQMQQQQAQQAYQQYQQAAQQQQYQQSAQQQYQQTAYQPAPQPQAQAPFPPQQQSQTEGQAHDDLPF